MVGRQLIEQLPDIVGIFEKEIVILFNKKLYPVKEIKHDRHLVYFVASVSGKVDMSDFELPSLSEIKKPPLGIMPKKIWMEQRMQDLAEVIKRNLKERPYSEKIGEWIRELGWLMTEYRKGEK